MLPAAALACLYAAMAAAYLAAADRWPAGSAPSLALRRGLRGAAAAGSTAGLLLSAQAFGWAAGIGYWAVALMTAGVAVVLLAPLRPGLVQRSGLAAAGLAVLLGIGGLA